MRSIGQYLEGFRGSALQKSALGEIEGVIAPGQQGLPAMVGGTANGQF